MANIALVCPPLPGHIHPMAALGRELIRRGHSVAFFHIPAIEPIAQSQGIGFRPVGHHGTDVLAARIQRMGEVTGLHSLRFAVECSKQTSDLLCQELPAAFRASSIDLVLADQNEPAATSVSEHLRIPFISVCPSLPLNREPAIPPPFFPWSYSANFGARLRNQIGYKTADWLISPINKTLNQHRAKWKLPPLRSPDDSFSRLAQLCQMTADFDFPRHRLPICFHYLGPFCDIAPSPVSFPFEQLNGQPLIYASLGTLQDKASRYFHVIAEACAGNNIQLVISLGGTDAKAALDLPGKPIVVKYAPQLALLEQACLTITHAGLNTVMQSLLFGVPMVALPITHDQPAIAARIKRAGVGETIPANKITVPLLRAAIDRVMSIPAYRSCAQRLKQSIQIAGGLNRAAAIVEGALESKRTCL